MLSFADVKLKQGRHFSLLFFSLGVEDARMSFSTNRVKDGEVSVLSKDGKSLR